jgi:hypothetical protein
VGYYEVAYHEHYDLDSRVRDVREQVWSAEEALKTRVGRWPRGRSEVHELPEEAAGLRSEVYELTERVEVLELSEEEEGE